MALEIKGEIYLTTQEAAELIDHSYSTVKTKNKEWNWPKYKVGRKTYFPKDFVITWIEKKIQRAS